MDKTRIAPVQGDLGRCTVEELSFCTTTCSQAESPTKPSTSWRSHYAQGHFNKFVREIYHLKDEKISVYDLKAEDDSDIIAVGWSDAAIANRVDLSSTGSFVIGFARRQMLEGVPGPISRVSWSMHKLRSVCTSSLAAEAQALAECEAELFLV